MAYPCLVLACHPKESGSPRPGEGASSREKEALKGSPSVGEGGALLSCSLSLRKEHGS